MCEGGQQLLIHNPTLNLNLNREGKIMIMIKIMMKSF